MLAHAVGDGGINGVFGEIALGASVVVAAVVTARACSFEMAVSAAKAEVADNRVPVSKAALKGSNMNSAPAGEIDFRSEYFRSDGGGR